MARKAYIYTLNDTGRNPFYVGSTLYPEKRLASHLYLCANGKYANKHLINKARKVGLENVTMTIVEEADEQTRWDLETTWIERLKNGGAKLANILKTSQPDFLTDYQDEYGDREFTKDEIFHVLDHAGAGQTGNELLDCVTSELLAIVESMFIRFPREVEKTLNG